MAGRVGLKVGGVSSFWRPEYFWGGRNISGGLGYNGCVTAVGPWGTGERMKGSTVLPPPLPPQPVLVRIEPKLDVCEGHRRAGKHRGAAPESDVLHPTSTASVSDGAG